MYSILIVDDEAIERDGLSFLIKDRYPFTIEQQPNGKKAWEAMQHKSYDVLLTDIKMPFMDGLELSKLVSQYFPKTVIVIISAYSEFEYAKRAMQAKVVHYLLKPVETKEFHEVMERVLLACQEHQAQSLEQDRQAEKQKQLALMRLLSGGGKQMAQHHQELEQCGLSLNDKYLRLLHLEAEFSDFVLAKELFERLVSGCCPFEYAWASFYPNSALLILISPSVIHNEAAAAMVQNMCRALRQLYGRSVSVLIGACIHGIDALADEAAELSRMRSKVYTAPDTILFIHDITHALSASADVELARSALETAIERQDLQQIKHHLHLLFRALEQSQAMGQTYLIHILYDLTSRIQLRFDRYDSKALARHMDLLMNLPTWEQRELLMLELVKQSAQLEPPSNDEEAASAIKRVQKIIRREYASQLSLDYLAMRVGVTPAYLSYLFKRETGETLVKYLTDYRMKQAMRMLEEGSMKINEVAKACGYENPSYFNRIFKAHMGITPSSIRGQEESDG